MMNDLGYAHLNEGKNPPPSLSPPSLPHPQFPDGYRNTYCFQFAYSVLGLFLSWLAFVCWLVCIPAVAPHSRFCFWNWKWHFIEYINCYHHGWVIWQRRSSWKVSWVEEGRGAGGGGGGIPSAVVEILACRYPVRQRAGSEEEEAEVAAWIGRRRRRKRRRKRRRRRRRKGRRKWKVNQSIQRATVFPAGRNGAVNFPQVRNPPGFFEASEESFQHPWNHSNIPRILRTSHSSFGHPKNPNLIPRIPTASQRILVLSQESLQHLKNLGLIPSIFTASQES